MVCFIGSEQVCVCDRAPWCPLVSQKLLIILAVTKPSVLYSPIDSLCCTAQPDLPSSNRTSHEGSKAQLNCQVIAYLKCKQVVLLEHAQHKREEPCSSDITYMKLAHAAATALTNDHMLLPVEAKKCCSGAAKRHNSTGFLCLRPAGDTSTVNSITRSTRWDTICIQGVTAL